MNKLLIATTNPGKFAEISDVLKSLNLQLVSLRELNIREQPAETGSSFTENAIIKAKFYSQKSGLPAIADDGGLEIDALGGEPGIHSHRWIDRDRESTDAELVAFAIEKLRGIKGDNRGAQLRTVVAFTPDAEKFITRESSVRGIIPETPLKTITPGFPYRSLLYLPEIGKFYNEAQLTAEENARYNHRQKALHKLAPEIIKYI